MADIGARDDQILAALILAADDDMGVRVTRVVTIDRHPIELGPQILLDSCHEAAGQRFEVVILHTVLGADNDAELMPVALRLFDPGAAVHPVSVGTIKLPAPAFARRAVALDIAQMRLGALEAVAAEFDGPEFQDRKSTRLNSSP